MAPRKKAVSVSRAQLIKTVKTLRGEKARLIKTVKTLREEARAWHASLAASTARNTLLVEQQIDVANDAFSGRPWGSKIAITPPTFPWETDEGGGP